jgi:MFS family permease
MDATRRDYFRQASLLQRQLGALMIAGLLLTWLASSAPWRWLELLCVALLWLCGAAIFVVSARLFTRHHPAISVFTDRLWFRGLREQVVMLRNVRDAQFVETRFAGLPWRFIELTIDDPRGGGNVDAESVRVPLDTIDGDADEMLALIQARAAQQRELSAVR